jgi:hypothetical protein
MATQQARKIDAAGTELKLQRSRAVDAEDAALESKEKLERYTTVMNSANKELMDTSDRDRAAAEASRAAVARMGSRMQALVNEEFTHAMVDTQPHQVEDAAAPPGAAPTAAGAGAPVKSGARGQVKRSRDNVAVAPTPPARRGEE